MRHTFVAALATGGLLLGCTATVANAPGATAPAANAPQAEAFAEVDGASRSAPRTTYRYEDPRAPYCPANAMPFPVEGARAFAGDPSRGAALDAMLALMASKPEVSFIEVEVAARLASGLAAVPEDARGEANRIAEGLKANLQPMSEYERHREELDLLQRLLSNPAEAGELQGFVQRLEAPGGLRGEELAQHVADPKQAVHRGLKAGVRVLVLQKPELLNDAILGEVLPPFVPGPHPTTESVDSAFEEAFWRHMKGGCRVEGEPEYRP